MRCSDYSLPVSTRYLTLIRPRFTSLTADGRLLVFSPIDPVLLILPIVHAVRPTPAPSFERARQTADLQMQSIEPRADDIQPLSLPAL